MGSPRERHGLSVLSARGQAIMPLPTPKRGVDELFCGLVPPQAENNPFKDKSWSFLLVVSAGTLKAAGEFAVSKGMAIMKHGFLHADLSVPRTTKAGAWTAKAELGQNRLLLRRSGDKQVGGTWALTDCINFRFNINKKLPPILRKPWATLQGQHSNFITMDGLLPSGVASGNDSVMDGTGVPKKRPASANAHGQNSTDAASPRSSAMKAVMKNIQKRPSRR